MSHRFWSALLVATATATAGIAAQAPDASQSASRGQSASADKIVVTGCVERSATAAPAPTGTSGRTGAAAQSTMFVLTKIESSPAGTTGNTSASSATPKASSYRLDDADQAKITPHLGHKVEITGMLDPQSRSSADAAGPAASSSAANAAPKLKVDSVRMIASTCTE